MPSPFAVLARHRNFRLFWIGQTLSLIGTWMQSMAQAWLALELTNNAFLVGLVAAVGSLPIVLFSMHAGVLADRYERLRLVKICQTLLLFEAALLWWFTWSGHVTIGWLLLIAAIAGAISSVEIPSRQSLVVELAGREDLPQAIALNSSGFNLARIVGPALAALVIAKLGIGWAFALNALSYFAVLIGLFMVRLSPWRPSAQLVRPLDGIRESFAYMRDTPLVAALMKLVTVYSVLGTPYLTLMPVFAKNRLGLGAGGYGLLLACVGVGGLIGALALAARSGAQAGSRTLRLSTYGYPIVLLVLSTLTSAWPAYVALLFAGMAMIANGAIANSMLQHNVPDALRGRLMAAYSFVVVGLAQTLGSFIAGALARALGVQWAIAAGAVIMLLYAAYVFERPPFRIVKTTGPSLT
ncbi:MAG TPA: MFS transporter [Gemmatimonadaceae bacterium]|nr:MFS transporter [Gemmatimonadaceae bacterium]